MRIFILALLIPAIGLSAGCKRELTFEQQVERAYQTCMKQAAYHPAEERDAGEPLEHPLKGLEAGMKGMMCEMGKHACLEKNGGTDYFNEPICRNFLNQHLNGR